MTRVKVDYSTGEAQALPDTYNIQKGKSVPYYLNVSSEQIEYARRLSYQNEEKVKDFGLDDYQSWKKDIQLEDFIGFIGETVVCDYFDLERPEFYPERIKQEDMPEHHFKEIKGDKTDIKTTVYQGDERHLLVYPDRMEERDIDRYLLLQYDETHQILKVAIDIPLEVFKEHSVMKNMGYGGRLALKISECPEKYRPDRRITDIEAPGLDKFE